MSDMSAPLAVTLEPFRKQLEGVSGQPQKTALEVLHHTGLPDRRVEDWKYTSLRFLAGTVFHKPGKNYDSAKARAALAALGLAEGAVAELPRLVFVNGHFVADLSVTKGLFACSFYTAGKAEPGSLVRSDREPLAALNTVLAENGVVISVPEGIDAGQVLLVSLGQADSDAVSYHPRHSVHVAKGGKLSLLSVQAGEGHYLHNPVTEVFVAAEAELRHVTLQAESDAAANLSTLYAQIEERGNYDSFVVGIGAALSRHEVHACLAESFAQVHINGVQRLAQTQHGDITSVITHAAPDCISRQTVRNVLDDRARGVFQGKVLVEQIAQKTDGYQMNQALLLSGQAEIDAKPQLEIYADDVKCSHGATVGALDDDQLFYMRSRGVPEGEARQILIDAFLEEVLELIGDETAREFCKTVIARRFPVSEEGA